MKRKWLIAYQWLTGVSDTTAGVLLYLAPQWTLRVMGVHASTGSAPLVAYIGALVFSVGLSCLYGAVLFDHSESTQRLETVWLLTAFPRAAVAIYVLSAVVNHALEPGWLPVALFDGGCVIVQAIGLRRRWLVHAG